MSPNHADGDDWTALIYVLSTNDGQEFPSLTANERIIQENNTANDGEEINTMGVGQEEHQEVSDPDTAIASDSVVTSAYTQPDSKMEGSNEPNTNGLICPTSMYLEFFKSLHIAMQR